MGRIVFLSILACFVFIAGGATTTTTTTTVSTPPRDRGKKPSQTAKVYNSKREYFTPTWKTQFSPRELKRQPKWFLTKPQPADGSFQARRFERHWIARSWKRCRTGQEASRAGYLDLYLYFNGGNYQQRSYPLTYPIMIAVNGRLAAAAAATPITKSPVKPTTLMATPEPCPTRHITQFYVPIPLTKWPYTTPTTTIKSFKRGGEFYVREYQGNKTTEYCEEQAEQLATDLKTNERTALDNYWICAQYATSVGEPKFEVWMKKK